MAVGGFGFLLLARLITKEIPEGHELWIWALAVVMCGYGWTLALFPSALVERSSGAILPLDSELLTSFGSIDQQASTQTMLTVSILFMSFLMTTHFARRRGGRIIIAVGVTVAGLITAIAGLWLQTTADRTELWQVAHAPSSVFGLFWYHGNAGAFLNLTWPVGIWLFMTLIQNRQRSFLKQVSLALLVVSVLTQIIAVFVNVSKMGHLILVLEFALLACIALRLHLRQHWLDRSNVLRLASCAALVLTLVAAGAWLTGASDSWSRWSIFSGRGFDDPSRRHAAEMAIKIGTEAGWTGTGPGTFEWISPHYAVLDPVLAPCRWRYAHNDYTQFFAEWGLLGCALLGATLILPVTRLLTDAFTACSKRKHSSMSYQRRLGLLCFGITIFAVLIHASVDFPLQIMAIQFQLAVISGLAVAMSLPPASDVVATPRVANQSRSSVRQHVQTAPAYFLSDG